VHVTDGTIINMMLSFKVVVCKRLPNIFLFAL
jgi:hypothetical protein